VAERASNELAAVYWLRSLPGIPENRVDVVLPDSENEYLTVAPGFVTVRTIGGSPHIHLPQRQPVMEINTWVAFPNDQIAPWPASSLLGDTIIAECLDQTNFGHVITHPNYETIRMMSAYPTTENTRVDDDDARYARYVFEMQMYWVGDPH
jgi:hypothetical protein